MENQEEIVRRKAGRPRLPDGYRLVRKAIYLEPEQKIWFDQQPNGNKILRDWITQGIEKMKRERRED